MLQKGKIIVIEGIDKAGKETQSSLLINALKFSGKVCTVMDFPDYTTPIGQEIRAFVDGKRNYTYETKHVLMSANRWEKKKEIESLIENNTIIIMDRYYQSNLVYGVSHGLNLKWLLNLDREFYQRKMSSWYPKLTQIRPIGEHRGVETHLR